MYEQYTDEQIVEMLIPKLNKATGHDWNDLFEYPKVCADMIKAISLAYRSGYVRGQLGRSFIIGEPKQTERWTSVNSNNVKKGDFVRYANEERHKKESKYYPAKDVVGKVIKVCDDWTCEIQWPEGSTSSNDRWYAAWDNLEVLKTRPTKAEKWVSATKDNIKVGSKVRMIDDECHKNNPWCFPDVGIVGVVTEPSYNNCKVQWPEGITIKPDRWWCNYERLEVLLCE